MPDLDDRRRSAAGASWLFVPGDRPDRFDRAARSGADQAVVDLEDAVTPTAKAAARDAVAAWLHGGGTAWVRIGAADTEQHERDLAALAHCPGLRGVVLPKAEDVDALRAVAARTAPSVGLLALVETARGVLRAPALAESGHADRLAIGTVDLALDLGADDTDEAMLLARSALVLASRAARLPGPVDGVCLRVDDPAAVAAAARRARSLGFAGKLCIHPRQVAAVTDAFAPTAAELAWAERVTAAAASQPGAGAFALDGEMVDRPVLERARSVLARRPPVPGAVRPS